MQKQGFRKRGAALALALVLLCTYVPFAAAETASYTGMVLMALNAEVKNRNASFATDREPADVDVEAAAAPDENTDRLLPDGTFEDPEPLSGPQALLRQAEVGDVAPQEKAAYHVGDTKRISSHYADSEGKRFRYVDMVCAAVSESATVWRESGTENDDPELNERIAAEMDVRVPQMLDFFGDKRIDTDGDGKIAVFLYEIDGEGLGGYFTVADLMDKVGRVGSVWHPLATTSNHMDCIHVQGHYDFEDTMETCLHEYQHYIEASYRFVGRNNFNALRATETFVNEGFSASAEFLLADVTHYASNFTYYAAPSKKLSLLHWSDVYGNYSLAFVFAQYMRTRYAALTDDLDSEIPGGSFYRTVLEARTPKNDKDTLSLIADMLYPEEMYPDLQDSHARCRQLLNDFWMAVYCQEPEGVHGFNGESWTSRIDVRDLVQEMPAGDTQYPVRSGMAAFYQIPTDETDTVRITRSDEQLTFIALAQKGYTLTFNANGGTDAPQPQILGESYTIKGIPYRSGYTFMGWALTPDASSAQYNSGERITLEADTTLYAVWETSPTVTTDTLHMLHRQGGEPDNNYRFVPQADGIYKLKTSIWSGIFVYLDGEPVECIDDSDITAGIRSFYFALKAGAAYDISFRSLPLYNNSAFLLTWQETCYSLTYCFDHPLVNRTWSRMGETVYSAEDPYQPSCVRFLGWAYTPDAVTPDVVPGESVTLTKDTTLYAVCAPDDVLPTDGSTARTTTKYDDFLYVLRPEQDGMYTLQWTPESEIEYDAVWLYDAQCNELLAVKSDAAVTCALRGGETYYLRGWTDSPAVTATCTKTSDRITVSLKFSVGKWACFNLKLRGITTYTIPDYTPVALDGREFLFWIDEQELEIYNPGDTITIAQDKVLTARWSDAPNTPADFLKASEYLAKSLFRALWMNLYLRIANWFAK